MSTTALPSSVVALDRSPLFRGVQRLLARAEREIALIDRAQPLNAAAERAALVSDFVKGEKRAPRFQYAAAPDLRELRAALDAAARALESSGGLGRAYADRACELGLEAAAAEHVGDAELRRLSVLRHRVGSVAEEASADEWAEHWLGAAASDEASLALHRSDDRADAESLLCALTRAARFLPLRIEVRENQVAVAAVGEGFIAIRPGVMHSRDTVQRIVLHELSGHAEPRVRAEQQEIALFRLGSARSSDDEEGRALLLERRAGLLWAGRARELARRHHAARSVHRGASFVETVDALLAHGQTNQEAVEAACRAHRGGGLAREIVYLPALARVERAFAEEPELERYLERGRLSVATARACALGFSVYESSTITGM